jgi:hypothetical protein
MTVYPINYVIVCKCGGTGKAVGFIDDGGPTGELRVHSRSSQVIMVVPVDRGGRCGPDLPHNEVVARLADTNLTETFWGDGHLMVTIRCIGCNDQAQMSRDTYLNVVNHLGANIEQFPLVPSPDSDDEQRHMVLLGVLNDMATNLKV